MSSEDRGGKEGDVSGAPGEPTGQKREEGNSTSRDSGEVLPCGNSGEEDGSETHTLREEDYSM